MTRRSERTAGSTPIALMSVVLCLAAWSCLDSVNFSETAFACVADSDCIEGWRCEPHAERDYGRCVEGAAADVDADTSTTDAVDDATTNTIDVTCTCPPHEICVDGGCSPGLYVFVTHDTTGPDFGGTEGADARCQSLADAAGVSAGSTWRAWLSVPGDAVSTRFTAPPDLPYHQLDGERVADDLDALLNSTLVGPITLSERGEHLDTREVWTHTNTSGGSAANNPCSGFTSADADGDFAQVGITGRVDATWTIAYPQFCNRTNVRLYCFEQ